MSLRQPSLNFINLLASRKGPAKILLHPYNPSEWFRGAYTTVQRTKTGGTQPSLRSRVSSLIFEYFPDLRVGTFDRQWDSLIRRVSKLGGFSAGQAQKICNILLKYHLVYFFSELDPAWNHKNSWVSSLLPKANIPIDSFVLFYGAVLYPDSFGSLIKFSRNARVCTHGNHKKQYGWSNLPFPYIKKLQTIFRAIAESKGISPLELEMRELWRP